LGFKLFFWREPKLLISQLGFGFRREGLRLGGLIGLSLFHKQGGKEVLRDQKGAD